MSPAMEVHFLLVQGALQFLLGSMVACFCVSNMVTVNLFKYRTMTMTDVRQYNEEEKENELDCAHVML